MKRHLRFNAKKRIIFVLCLLLVLAVSVIMIFSSIMVPTVMEISQATIKNLAVQCMNEAIADTLNGLDSYDLLNITRDSMGNVSMIQSNTLKLNEIATRTAVAAQQKINNLGSQGIGIPIGTVIGGPIFNGKGFIIYVDVIPIGAVISTFNSEFSSAGINQTKHKVFLTLNASVKIVVSGEGQQVKITNQVMISESIIIGHVPDTYLESSRSELLPLVP